MSEFLIRYKGHGTRTYERRVRAKSISEVLRRCGAAARVVLSIKSLGEGSGTAGGYLIPEKTTVLDVKDRLRRAGKLLEDRDKPPRPMPGYGRIFVNDNDVGGKVSQVWYVGGDGDEKGFSDVVEETLRRAYPGMGEFIYEAESFPPKDEGWVQVYPQQTKKKSPDKPGTPDKVFTVAVDLHGTLADHQKGDGPSPIGPPLEGAKEAMEEFRRLGYRTVINSVYGDVEEIGEWLTEHGIPCDYINESPWGNDTETSGKIDADVYVDDRGLHFKGDWDRALEKVEERFKETMKSLYRKHLSPDSPKRKSWSRKLGDAVRDGDEAAVEQIAQAAVEEGVTDAQSLRYWLGQGDGTPEFLDGVQRIADLLNDRSAEGYGETGREKNSEIWPKMAKNWTLPQKARWMVDKWAALERSYGKMKGLEAAAAMASSAPLGPEEDRRELVEVAQSVKGTRELGKLYDDLHAAGPDESMWRDGEDREFGS